MAEVVWKIKQSSAGLVARFEETVSRQGERIAVIDAKRSATFGQLRDAAWRIAHAIANAAPEARNEPVGIYLTESIDYIEAIVGTLYSGNLYAPLIVGYGEPLLRSVLEQLQPVAIISDLAHCAALIRCGVPLSRIILIDQIDATVSVPEPVGHREVIDVDPVYVMHTSGSTGVPKGVTIRHASLIDFIDWVGSTFEVGPADRMATCNSFGFDNSVLEIFSMLCFGSSLLIMRGFFEPDKVAPPHAFLELCNREEVTFIFWMPSRLAQIAEAGALSQEPLKLVNKVLFCGEVMHNRHLNYWRRHLPQALYANLYGPTEITDATSCYIVDRPFSDDEPLPIGTACRNSRVLLIDENGRAVAPGEQGEILVRGICVAAGYWNQPELTAAAFIQNPLHNRYRDVCYKTGDIGQLNERGELLFLGRRDSQIKYFGMRLELGEIEQVARSMEGIAEACVFFYESLNRIAITYTAEPPISRKQLAQFLIGRLPVIPGEYFHREAFPRLNNGKIDRNRLKTEIGAEISSQSQKAP